MGKCGSGRKGEGEMRVRVKLCKGEGEERVCMRKLESGCVGVRIEWGWGQRGVGGER